MGNQPENQQYKNPKDDDFQKQGIDSGKKAAPADKDLEKESGAGRDDDSTEAE